MLCSNAYPVSDEFFDFDGKVAASPHDQDGAGPLYRLYQAAHGWIFLAAPRPEEWKGLCKVIKAERLGRRLGARRAIRNSLVCAANWDGLADVLASTFFEAPAEMWELEFRAQAVLHAWRSPRLACRNSASRIRR